MRAASRARSVGRWHWSWAPCAKCQRDWAAEQLPPALERRSCRATQRWREWSATSIPAARRKRRHWMLGEFLGTRKRNLDLFSPKISVFCKLHAWIIGIFDLPLNIAHPLQKGFETPTSCWLNCPLMNISYSRFLPFFY